MNILVATGIGTGRHAFGNMGDVAMLQTALARLARLWPRATLSVLTGSPENLGRYCATATPLLARGSDLWLGENLLLGRYTRFIPKQIRGFAIRSKRRAALRFPRILRWFLTQALRLQNRHDELAGMLAFAETIASIDLVIVSGAGGFFDSCREWNMQTLDVLEAAVQRNIPVAMFAQHFGPLTDPEVLYRAKRILPAVDLIMLRGNPAARALLETLGVSPSRILITGDDAIELAYETRHTKTGIHLGINFRLRTSAGTEDTDLEAIRPIVQGFAKKHNISLIPIPIAIDESTRDYWSIIQLLKGFDDQSDGGAGLASPTDIIKQLGECKVLVTCAYHAAVFALSQGIPVVALAKSSYFTEKFLGLEHQFGLGCNIVHLDKPDPPENLLAAIESAWLSAESVRIPLQQAARRQIESSWSACRLIENLVRN